MPKIASLMFDFEKQHWLTQIEMKFRRAIDIESDITIAYARTLVKKFPGPYSIDQICAIYEYLFSEWRYVDDPRGIEYIAPASISVEILAGDCDDFAALIAALIECIGGRCRIIIASHPKQWHAYTEVFMGYGEEAINLLKTIYEKYDKKYKGLNITSPEAINYHQLPNSSVWLNLDWTASHPGGSFFPGTIERIIYPR